MSWRERQRRERRGTASVRVRRGQLLVALGLAGVLSAPATAASLDDFKAVLLLGFVQLSEWSSFEESRDDFQACVFENAEFAERLGRVAEGERVAKRGIRVDSVSDEVRLRECDLLFVPNASTEAFRAAARTREAGRPLVVGERPEFARTLGAIHLFVEDGRLRFEINRAASERAGAKLSSRILRRAKLVD